jgi:predicted small lipoprotein YifL
MNTGKNFVAGAIAIMMLVSVTACQKEGPAEHAGKEIDKAVDNAGQHIEKAGEKIQDTAKGDKD